MDVTASERLFYIWKLEMWWISLDDPQFFPEGRVHIRGNWFWRKYKTKSI